MQVFCPGDLKNYHRILADTPDKYNIQQQKNNCFINIPNRPQPEIDITKTQPELEVETPIFNYDKSKNGESNNTSICIDDPKIKQSTKKSQFDKSMGFQRSRNNELNVFHDEKKSKISKNKFTPVIQSEISIQ